MCLSFLCSNFFEHPEILKDKVYRLLEIIIKRNKS